MKRSRLERSEIDGSGLTDKPEGEEAMDDAKAATMLSAVVRRRLARRRLMHDQNFQTWNRLDEMKENLAVRSIKKFRDVFGGTANKKDAQLFDVPSAEIPVEIDYEGLHIKWPLDVSMVIDILENFKDGKRLHPRYIVELIEHAQRIFEREQTVKEIVLQPKARITIVGDLHGQLQDLLSIFKLNGIPDLRHHYLFNGDFVDRGDDGIGVMCSLLAFKCLFPSTVHLNRGNHECRKQNSVFGFEEEVLSKYRGINGRVLLHKFHGLFDTLPLCSVLQRKVFIVHGGLPDIAGVTLDDYRRIPRRVEPPMGEDSLQSQLFECALWSDPVNNKTGCSASTRGAGVDFGKDRTHAFLRKNGLSLMIRSHQCVEEGFTVMHDERVITVFSASRYCGKCTNKGAYVTLSSSLGVEMQQYYAHSMEDIRFKTQSRKSRVATQGDSNMCDDMVQMAMECIVNQRPELYRHFMALDPDRTGTVSRVQWADTMAKCLEGMNDVPFLTLQSEMCALDDSGRVPYIDFLERYKIEFMSGVLAEGRSFGDQIIEDLCRKIHAAMGGGNAEQAFQMFDVDGSGEIDYDEFVGTMKRLDCGLTDDQIFELNRGMDNDQDQVVDLSEFLERFESVFDAINEEKGTFRNIRQLVGAIEAEIDGGIEASFRSVDSEGKGWLNLEAFSSLVGVAKDALAHVTSEDVGSMFSTLDRSCSQKVSLSDIRRVIDVGEPKSGPADAGDGETALVNEDLDEDTKPQDDDSPVRWTRPDFTLKRGPVKKRMSMMASWQEGIIYQINNFVYNHRLEIASLFRDFDRDNRFVHNL